MYKLLSQDMTFWVEVTVREELIFNIESRYDFLIWSNSWGRIDFFFVFWEKLGKNWSSIFDLILDAQINSEKRKNKVNSILNYQPLVFSKKYFDHVVMSSFTKQLIWNMTCLKISIDNFRLKDTLDISSRCLKWIMMNPRIPNFCVE